MPRRRVFGTVFRRKLPKSRRGQGGNGQYHPGWYVRIRQGDREVTRYAGADRPMAVEFLRRLQRDAERLDLLGEFPANERTFAQFAEEYLTWVRRNQTRDTYERKRSGVNSALVAFFGSRLLQEVDQPQVERFLMSRPNWKPGTRNRYLSLLSAIYKRAIALGYVQDNPTAGVRRAREDRTPLPLIPLPQQHELLEAMPSHLYPLVLLALDTGARLGELLRMRWSDVDLEAGTILVRQSKNHQPRVLRMSARLKKHLEEWSEERTGDASGDPRLFADLIGEDGRLKAYAHRTYKQTCADVGYPDLRFHDLRHLVAINLVRAGLDLPSVQALLGHKSLQSTLRYAEYADQTATARAAAVLDSLHQQRQQA